MPFISGNLPTQVLLASFLLLILSGFLGSYIIASFRLQKIKSKKQKNRPAVEQKNEKVSLNAFEGLREVLHSELGKRKS